LSSANTLVSVNETELGNACLVDLFKPLVIVVGIPAFNEEVTIAKVITSAQRHADVVVVCDDGSSDMTREIAERLGAVVVRHEHNLGYGAALQSLFEKARELNADVLVTLDSDGQHDASEIPLFVKPIGEGIAEVVYGSRFLDKKGTSDMPLYRKIGIKVITKLANGSGKQNVSDAQSGFRAYSREALERLTFKENGMSVSLELLRAVEKSELKVCEVPISCKYNMHGLETSTKNPITHGIGLIMSIVKLAVEEKPLIFVGLPGLISIIAGIIFGIWMMNIYVVTYSIVTNIALASLGFVLIGFLMISTATMLYAITRMSKKASVN
jgi:glycosyltransferase involved in cell wall biosynthesis